MSPLQQVIWELHNQGLGAKRIAARLGKKPDNIKTQLKRIKAKINAPGKIFDEDIDDILPKLETQQSQIAFLASRGYTTGQIAERTGAGANIISVQKWRSRQEKLRIRRYFISQEEIKTLPAAKNNFDSDIARVTYEVFVKSDRITHEELAKMGTQGLGGWPAKKAILNERAKMLKTMIASGRQKVLVVTVKEGPWYNMVNDMLGEYKKINEYTYIPNAWDLHEKEVNERIKAALATVKTKMIGYKDGVEVYELNEQKETAVVIRPLGNNQAAVVATAWKSDGGKIGKKGVEGPVSMSIEGIKLGDTRVDPAGVAFQRQGEKWVTLGAGLLRKDDMARLRGEAIVEVMRWNECLPQVKIIKFDDMETAWAVAAFVLKKPCWILTNHKLYDFRRLRSNKGTAA
ncbi:hypothetical protein SDD30_09645 [Moorella naiadis]|uniref:helix-turn-helix transcriptional regulator n=1 Tax=Moorella naiadis (nom. illeg.) TaxID=3093670 RepID=UPI003D9C8EA7